MIIMANEPHTNSVKTPKKTNKKYEKSSNIGKLEIHRQPTYYGSRCVGQLEKKLLVTGLAWQNMNHALRVKEPWSGLHFPITDHDMTITGPLTSLTFNFILFVQHCLVTDRF